MGGLPAGVVTCAFTDIEGSTRLLKELGPAFSPVLEQHHRLLREVWRDHGGHEVKTIGDAFMVVFGDAGQALAAGAAAQRAIARAAWPPEAPIRVRMGMHTGFARPAGGDYTALVVNQAARVVGAAHGGQVLASDAVVEAASGVPEGVEVQPLGRFRVRDFDDPVGLHAVGAPDLPEVAAPPRVRPAEGHNIVRPTTSLVGRDADLERLRALLAPGVPATVTGPGGVGKTRLAVETALAVAAEWPDGAWFVDLAPLEDPALLAEAVGDAVGVAASARGRAWADVLEHLRARRALLVLDNCEHLRGGVARAAAELLAGCPQVALLLTSRVPLGLRGERVLRLEPLATAGPGAPAVELFLARTSAAVDPEQAAALCAEVDGLPLGVELAAARCTSVPAADLLERLRRTPTALRSSDPTLPERQRSLQRLLDYGWELLDGGAQVVLGRLSVFAGGFDVDGAEAVAAGGPVDRDEVAEHLWDLVDASLVRLDDAAGTTRYRLPVPVRAHSAQRADPGDRTAALDRLARLLLGRLGPDRADVGGWVAAVQLELANVRAATSGTSDPASAHALGWCVGRLHDLADRQAEGLAELERLMAARPEEGPALTALASLGADLHLRRGDVTGAEAWLGRAEDLEARVGVAPWGAGAAGRARADLALRAGDPRRAAALVAAALAEAPPPRLAARLHDLLGIVRSDLGDLGGAVAAFRDALAVAEDADLRAFLALAHGNLAEALLRTGAEADAARHQLASLDLGREHGQRSPVAFSLMVAARMAAGLGRHEDALVLQAGADLLLEQIGFALYDEDAQLRAALVADAGAALGPAGREAARRRSEALGAQGATVLAEDVLREVASTAVERPGEAQ